VRTADSLSEAIEIAKSGGDCMVKCPAHADNQASLHVRHGDTHPVIMTCHATCSVEDIMAAGGIEISEILAERDESLTPTNVWTPVRDVHGNYLNASNVYPYLDEEGKLLYEVVRVQIPTGGKTFRQRQPDPSERSGWKWNMEGVRRILYRLQEVLAAKDEGRTIYLVEGEKDVETLRSKGEVATTAPMGAGKWTVEYTKMLEGATIVIIADADATGRAHARTVREQLMRAGCNVTLAEAVDGCKDITDHFKAGHDLTELVVTNPEQEENRILYGADILDIIKRDKTEVKFVVPGVLAAGERLMIVGFEGRGKSTFLRQFAVCVAAGLHPFTFNKIEPKKVLFLDAENHPDQIQESWEHLLGLSARHDAIIRRGNLIVVEAWDEEIDLTSEEGEAWMIERMHATQPELLVMGPIYNLAAEDVSSHAVVGRLKSTINKARALYSTAVVMEHHAPHKGPNDSARAVRPYGSSTFLKWPDYGYGFKPMEELEGEVYEFEKQRYDRVRGRAYPSHMRNGTPNTDEFPWVPCLVTDEGEVVG